MLRLLNRAVHKRLVTENPFLQAREDLAGRRLAMQVLSKQKTKLL
jgi:hypothetical protein